MREAMEQVRKFHQSFDIPVGTGFGDWHSEVRELRRALLQEEFDEYISAERMDDVVELADALADVVVIICGTALSYGIPLAEVFDEVMRTNMAKLGPDGKPIRRADGKVLKPEGWSPPNIHRILMENGWSL